MNVRKSTFLPPTPAEEKHHAAAGLGEVVVDHDVHALDVDAAAEEVRRHEDALLEVLEVLVAVDALVLAQARVDADGGEVALREQPVQLRGPRDLAHEDDDLVEVQRVQQVVELAVLLALLQLDVVLLEPVQRELGVVVDLASGASARAFGRFCSKLDRECVFGGRRSLGGRATPAGGSVNNF